MTLPGGCSTPTTAHISGSCSSPPSRLSARLIRNQVDQLLVSAAIEVLSGERRKPRRWRARSEDRLPQFWQEVGPDRDRRSEADPLADVMRLLDQG